MGDIYAGLGMVDLPFSQYANELGDWIDEYHKFIKLFIINACI